MSPSGELAPQRSADFTCDIPWGPPHVTARFLHSAHNSYKCLLNGLGFLGDNARMALGQASAFKGIPPPGGRLATTRRY